MESLLLKKQNKMCLMFLWLILVFRLSPLSLKVTGAHTSYQLCSRTRGPHYFPVTRPPVFFFCSSPALCTPGDMMPLMVSDQTGPKTRFIQMTHPRQRAELLTWQLLIQLQELTQAGLSTNLRIILALEAGVHNMSPAPSFFLFNYFLC